jgi:glycosyltransferase involved in cell wall biosynthesis
LPNARQSSPQGFAIIHLCEALASGLLRVVPPLANESASNGIPTVVIHGRRPETPSNVAVLFDPGVRLVAVDGWGDRSRHTSLLSTMRAARALRRELSVHRRGIVHMHSTHAGVVGRLIPARGWSCFYTPQGYAFLNPAHPLAVGGIALAIEIVLAGRAHTLACSRAEGEVAARMLRAKRVSVVQNGLDLALTPAAKRNENSRLVVASVGRAYHQRRPDLFAQLARQLREEPEIEFRWFGDGPEAVTLARAGIAVSGWLPQAAVASAVGRSDVVVHFSAFEGLPLALLEAMTMGRPIIASDLPVIREVVGNAALVVRGPAEAADAVRLLRADHGLREALGARARERVRRLFSERAMVERTHVVYGVFGDDYPYLAEPRSDPSRDR